MISKKIDGEKPGQYDEPIFGTIIKDPPVHKVQPKSWWPHMRWVLSSLRRLRRILGEAKVARVLRRHDKGNWVSWRSTDGKA